MHHRPVLDVTSSISTREFASVSQQLLIYSFLMGEHSKSAAWDRVKG
jgi:hypothetical protein